MGWGSSARINFKMTKQVKIILVLFWLFVLVGCLIWLVQESNTKLSENISDDNGTTTGTYIKGCYYKIGNEIYCGSKKDVLLNVDINSFQVIDYLVAKDKNHVYVINQIYPDLDSQTFNKFSKDGLDLFYLFSDKNGIYNMGLNHKLVSLPLDINTATSVDGYYIRDKNGVYFNDYSVAKVNDADSSTFHILGGCVSVEKSYAEYAADKSHVFLGTQALQGIDPNHFVQIAKIESNNSEIPYKFFLWEDTNSKHIYVYCGILIKEADYYTFEYKDGRAQDKNNYYNFNTGGGNYTIVPKN